MIMVTLSVQLSCKSSAKSDVMKKIKVRDTEMGFDQAGGCEAYSELIEADDVFIYAVVET